MKTNLLNLEPSLAVQAVRDFAVSQGQPAYRGGQVVRRLWHTPVATFEAMTDLPKAFRAALDEAFVNAVKHGNKSNPNKLLRITAELSPNEACFTVEDEGEGFDVGEIPDPCDPANLFRTSGRGVLLIYNIMDEVEYNAQGNRVKMVKRPETPVEAQLVDPNTPEDKHV